ncbi:MAG TPA: nucleotidyltransferase family protein [Candidatus Acidoferrum sp.]|nr:nucleotidyltransferase family protein [Candidatus Acidoferrum sp.]
MLAVAILAAGESRRMGTPKALLDYRGKNFVEHLIGVTQHPRVGLLRVVLGAKADDIRAQIAVNPDAIVVNDQWQRGQLSSIQTAIRSLPQGATEALMLCPVDHPTISRETIAQLIAGFDRSQKAIIVPVYKERRGHHVIFRAALYDELLAASPEIGARQVVWAHANGVEQIPTDDEGVILNVDDPATYQNVIAKK